MYAAPPEIAATVSVRITDVSGTGDRRPDLAEVRIDGAPTPTHLEGPCFASSGNLWVADTGTGSVLLASLPVPGRQLHLLAG